MPFEIVNCDCQTPLFFHCQCSLPVMVDARSSLSNCSTKQSLLTKFYVWLEVIEVTWYCCSNVENKYYSHTKDLKIGPAEGSMADLMDPELSERIKTLKFVSTETLK